MEARKTNLLMLSLCSAGCLPAPPGTPPGFAERLEERFAERVQGQLDVEEACRGFLTLAKDAVAACVAVGVCLSAARQPACLPACLLPAS